MPLDGSSLITTIGGSTSNSYVTLQEFADYRDLNRIDSSEFDLAAPDNKVRALIMAASRLQVENWLGERVASTQRLAWPRLDVQKIDPVGVGYGGYGYGYNWGWGDVYANNEIPQQIKDAQCELALAYLGGFDDGEEDAIDSFSADGVSVKFRAQRPNGGLPPRIQQLIAWLIGGTELRRA